MDKRNLRAQKVAQINDLMNVLQNNRKAMKEFIYIGKIPINYKSLLDIIVLFYY